MVVHPGKPLNPLGDVRWVHDPRLDHEGDFLHQPPEMFGDIRVAHMGVHHVFPDAVPTVWEAAEDKPGTNASGRPTRPW